MTVRDLIELLSEFDPNAEVRLAHQPRWAFEYSISTVAETEPNADDQTTVYIAEGNQIGYLPQEAADAIGW